MAVTTEVCDQVQQILDVGDTVVIDIACTGVSCTAPVLDQTQKILDVDVMVAIKISVTVLFFSQVLFYPLDGGLVIFLTCAVVEHDPEWLGFRQFRIQGIHLQFKEIDPRLGITAVVIGQKEIQMEVKTSINGTGQFESIDSSVTDCKGRTTSAVADRHDLRKRFIVSSSIPTPKTVHGIPAKPCIR